MSSSQTLCYFVLWSHCPLVEFQLLLTMCIWESCKPFGMAGAHGANGSVTRSKAEEATELKPQKAF